MSSRGASNPGLNLTGRSVGGTSPSASPALRAQLSWRIRSASPKDWREFGSLWMAFNAIYGGEPDRKERSRVMSVIRRYITQSAARRVLRECRSSVDRILDVPPGNMQLDALDPSFRAASRRCAAIYRNPRETPRGRLAAVGGVLYQVRCNLVHGTKDPSIERDRVLVRESLDVLRALVPELEAGFRDLHT